MRKLLISLLLASAAATPALADPPKDRQQEREQAREEREQAREERQQARQERPSPRVERVEPQLQVRQQSVAPTARAQTLDRGKRVNVQTVREQSAARRDLRADQRQQLRQDRVDARELRQASRAPVVSNVPRPGTQPPPRVDNRRSPAPTWSTNWRHNNKYDWYNWRKRNRSLFHLGFYYDPFGWGYQPYSIGWRMWPSYYGSRYWISDPWRYRLPYAPPGYRWVRYWNDAVLVDTWSGQVVDVLYNFFW
jgi:Ni/Co efflux regulator RcnB